MLELRKGIYYVRLMVNGKRIQQSTRTGDKSIAKQIHNKMLGEMVLGMHEVTKPKTPTFREAFDLAMKSHWASKKDKVSPRISFNIVAGIIGEDKLLGDVTEDTYQDIIEAMYEDDYAPATINRKMAVLSKLMKLNARSLSRLPRVPLQEEFAGRKRYLTDSEETALFGAIDARIEKHGGREGWVVFKALVTFLIETGVRLGEALRVRPDAIEDDRKELHVWESKGDITRTLPLTDRAYSVVKVVGGSFQVSKDSVEHMWRIVRDDLGKAEDRGFVIHCLRHTCCTRLIKAGVNLHAVQKWMGHKRIETTLIYAHLDTEDLHGCRDSLAQRCTKSLPKVGLKLVAQG